MGGRGGGVNKSTMITKEGIDQDLQAMGDKVLSPGLGGRGAGWV